MHCHEKVSTSVIPGLNGNPVPFLDSRSPIKTFEDKFHGNDGHGGNFRSLYLGLNTIIPGLFDIYFIKSWSITFLYFAADEA